MKKNRIQCIAAAAFVIASPLQLTAQDQTFFGGYSFDVVAPYLLQAGMYDVVKQTLSARQNVDFDYDFWNAFWIECPGADPTGYGVYCFRKDLELATSPIGIGKMGYAINSCTKIH